MFSALLKDNQTVPLTDDADSDFVISDITGVPDPDYVDDDDTTDELIDMYERVKISGIAQADIDLIKSRSLLAGTSILALATESFGGRLEDVLTTEGLGAAVAQKTKQILAKSVAYVGAATASLREKIGKMVDEMKTAVGAAKNISIDAAKAHPYATAAAAVAAIVALAAAIGVAKGAITTGDAARARDAFRKIKFRGFSPEKVTGVKAGPTSTTNAIAKIDPTIKPIPGAGQKSTFGSASDWTVEKAKSLLASLTSALNSLWEQTAGYRGQIGKYTMPVAKKALDGAAYAVGYPYSKIEDLKHEANKAAHEGNFMKAKGYAGLYSYIIRYFDKLVLGAIGFVAFGAVQLIWKGIMRMMPKSHREMMASNQAHEENEEEQA